MLERGTWPSLKKRAHPRTNQCYFLRKIGYVAHAKQESKLVPHPAKNILTSTRPLKLPHMDLFGPIAYISICYSKYGLVIIDDFSRFTWVFFLQDKSEVQGIVKKFIKRAQNEYELKIKNMRSDNGSKFEIQILKNFLMKKGSSMSSSLHILPNKMVLWRGRIEL